MFRTSTSKINHEIYLPVTIEEVEDFERMVVYEMRFMTKHNCKGHESVRGSLKEDLRMRGLHKQAKFFCEYYGVEFDDVYSYYFNKHYNSIYS